MEPTSIELAVLERYREKCASAGGPREGYVLRRRAIELGAPGASAQDVDSALGGLVERGLLAASEKKDFYFLTAAGVREVEAL
jgi:hypothetical protein